MFIQESDMRPRSLALAALFASLALPLQASVTVTYGDADRFTDAGDRSNDPRKIVQAIAVHLEALGRRLTPQSNVAIEVLDLDRAGRTRMNLPTEARIVNGKGDMPCIELRYALDTAPPVRERVCDPDFLRPLGPRDKANDPLVYEKRMLDEWFERRIVKHEAPR
jgi:hypothetical protein